MGEFYLSFDQGFGLVILVGGLSLIFQGPIWISFIRKLYDKDDQVLHFVGLGSGLFLFPVAVTLIWNANSGGIDPSLITLVFLWVIFIKSFLLIVWPQPLMRLGKRFYANKSENVLKWYVRVYGVLYILLGLLLIWL